MIKEKIKLINKNLSYFSNIMRSVIGSSSFKNIEYNFYSILDKNEMLLTLPSMQLLYYFLLHFPIIHGRGRYNISGSVKASKLHWANVTHCAGRYHNIGVKLQLLIAVSKLYEGLLLPALETGLFVP